MREDILKFIDKYRKANGYAPTQSEIARGLKVKRQNVNYHFKNMGEDLSQIKEYSRFFL